MLQQFSLLALPIICFYNGELGPKNKVLQMLFYVLYPLHLFIFYIINTFY
ncbi:MAG: TraX family protein [Sedimentibacter sp.]